MDPQHRVLLEATYTALQDAGYDPRRYPGSIGIYAGGSYTFYAATLRSQQARLPAVSPREIHVGTALDFLVTRVAYKLGFRGPAVTVQAACATSLVAIHMAAQALRAGECDLALAGGVSVRVPHDPAVYTAGSTISRDGFCRAFDAGAQGVVSGDGVGIVALKRLRDAIDDGDCIRAVIRGSAVNNDGAARIGYAAPGVEGQCAVIRAAQEMAAVDPATIDYVEAHGAGTPLGDPIEVAALSRAFRTGTARGEPCWIGSVKTNIGHTDTAAGVAGFIKAVFTVQRGQIPASLHFTEPNSEIDFDSSPFRVSTRLREWPHERRPRRAGVSSFGLGGTNAHVVLEEPPESLPSERRRPWQLLVLSAKTASALDATTAGLADHVRSHPDLPLADVAWTLQAGREEHSLRRFAVAGDDDDAAALLAEGSRLFDGESAALPRPVVFVFRGENAADAVTGSDLSPTEPEFRAAIDECCRLVEGQFGLDVRRLLQPGASAADAGPDEAHAAVFALEYALARLWTHWGVQPSAVLGEGPGAFVAATVAGIFSPADALRLTIAEARSGSDFDEVLSSVERRAPIVPLLSEWQGRWLSPEDALATDYWAAHPGARANPRDVLSTLLAEQDRILLELGPGRSATTSALRDSGGTSRLLVAGTTSDVCDLRSTLTAAGELWVAGTPISWSSVHAGERRRRVPLPTYPFERRRWIVERDDALADAVASPVATGAPGPPRPSEANGEEKHVRPTVAALFAEILALEQIDADESFFDVGGDSLIAAQLLARVHEEFPVQLDLRTVFEAPTVNEFAALVAGRMTGTRSAVDADA